MNTSNHPALMLAGAALAAFAAVTPIPAAAQVKTFLIPDAQLPPPPPPCKGKVAHVSDLAFEGTRQTGWNFANTGGGGIGGRFDPVPLLTTQVALKGGCLNAHFSAIAGSPIYPGVSNMTLFEITLTNAAGVRVPLVGHYPIPYGTASPAVALSAEYDVDMLGANFYMPIGDGAQHVPPGNYRLDVWWAGGPTAAGGAIGAAFTLKLYLQ